VTTGARANAFARGPARRRPRLTIDTIGHLTVRQKTSACVIWCAAAGAMTKRPFFTHWAGRIAETSARSGRRFCARDVVTTINATRGSPTSYRDESTFDVISLGNTFELSSPDDPSNVRLDFAASNLTNCLQVFSFRWDADLEVRNDDRQSFRVYECGESKVRR